VVYGRRRIGKTALISCFVIARRLKSELDRRQLPLDINNEYEYAFYATNTDGEAVDVAICYEKCGNSENYIKEAKYDKRKNKVSCKIRIICLNRL
jgi:AAA+ ATPase superfamily predicted ATPase